MRINKMNNTGPQAALVEDQLCFALYAASRAATAVYRPYLDRLGLTYPRYLVMLVLWQHDEMSIGTLGERLFLDSGTLSPLLKKLEVDGLIRRFRDPDDERVVKLKLTPEGRALEEPAAKMRSALSCKLGLSAARANGLREEVHMLFNQLLKLVEDSSERNEDGIHGGGNGNGRARRARHLIGQEPGRAAFDAERNGRQRRVRNHQS
jgi:MarR family transcriptional regulator, organic hydroperoxide resistance regulator